jgi:hypothetical protein
MRVAVIATSGSRVAVPLSLLGNWFAEDEGCTRVDDEGIAAAPGDACALGCDWRGFEDWAPAGVSLNKDNNAAAKIAFKQLEDIDNTPPA